MGDFPKLGGTCLWVPNFRMIIFGGLYLGPLIKGNYYVVSARLLIVPERGWCNKPYTINRDSGTEGTDDSDEAPVPQDAWTFPGNSPNYGTPIFR